MTTPRDLDFIAAIADELPAAIWVGRAPGGETVYTNREFREILGLTAPPDAERGNYVGPYGVHTVDGSPYPEDRMPFERVLAARATVEVDDLVIHRHDGGRVHLRVFAKPLFDERGEVAYVLESFTDITREVLAERARAEGEARLRQAQRMDSIGNLAGGVAHDFNNLLATIKILSSLLRAGEVDPARIAAFGQIDQVTDSAAKLTRSLLGFARRGKNLSQRVALDAAARSVTEIVARTIDRRIDVRFEGDPVDVVGDVTQLEQVIMNLLLNARDAIEGSGTITVRTRAVHVDAARAATLPPLAPGAHAALEVSDTGTGIDPALRDRIFEPYFTTRATGSGAGTGLGLAVVYGVAQSHRGAVEVAPNHPRGTTMRVLLPAAEGPRPASTPPAASRALCCGQGKVLLVDDDALVRAAAALALRTSGYEVIEAADRVEAVERYARHQGELAAVVLDMNMPRMGGRETYLAMRERDASVPVLLVSGYALNDEAQAILDLGVRGFLAKPHDAAALSEAVARLLG